MQLRKIINSKKLVQIVFIGLALYHLLLGIIGLFLPNYIEFIGNNIFGFDINIGEDIQWIFGPLTAYGIAFGLFSLVMIRNPIKYINFFPVFSFLLYLRAIQRTIYLFSEDGKIFEISSVVRLTYIFFVIVVSSFITYIYLSYRKKTNHNINI